MSDAATDFSWLDEAPAVTAPKNKKRRRRIDTSEHNTPDPNSGRQKMLRQKNKIAAQKKREGIGNVQSTHRRTMTPAKWQKCLELSANGLTRKDMIKAANITPETFEAYMIATVGAAKQLRESDLVWLRRCWPLDEVETMLSKISLGQTVKAAGIELGYNNSRLRSFYQLMRNDRALREMYDDARELQAESWMDDNIDISDNRGGDTFIDMKGNERIDHAVIQRDKIRIDTRQWTMGVLHRKRFGEHKHFDHGGEVTINHAVTLANARKRLEKTRQPPATIDNATQQVI